MAMAVSFASASFLLAPSHSAAVRWSVALRGEFRSRNCALGARSQLFAREIQCSYAPRVCYARRVQTHAQAEEAIEQGAAVDDDEVCELVNDLDVELGDEEEGFSGYYIQALKNNNGAGVLLLSDVYGHESSGIRDFVYRLACFGYKYDLAPIFC